MADSDDQITVRKRGSQVEKADEPTPSQNQELATPDGEAVQPQNQQQPQQQESAWKTVLWRVLIFWLVWQFFRSKPGPANNVTTQQTSSSCLNLFRAGDQLDLSVYLSEEPYMKNVSSTRDLFWREEGITYGNWSDGPYKDGSRHVHGEITISEKVQNNGSLYMHVFMVKAGYSLDRTSEFYSRAAVVNRTRLMTLYKKRRVHKTKNLLTGESTASPDMVKAHTNLINSTELISYWHPNLTVNMLDDQTQWVRGSLPAPLNEYIVFDNESNFYYPVLYLNDYWNYASDSMPINDTTKTLELHLTYQPISLFKWQMYVSQQMRSQWTAMLGDTQEHTDEEQDMLKRTLRETNPYLLGLTIVVSLVHSVFEFMAFKNDIQFWRNRKSLEGLSVRSVFFNVFQSMIVVLFVFDNETNTVVVISCGVGLLIELWKITKVVDISIDRTRSFGPFPRITIQDKSSYKESPTRKYDMLAFKYLSWALFPLLGCYAVYSIIYNEHKGYYSFVLSLMYGFLLTFGFIMMTPQLFINYKLKSVAHLPWRMLTYKALNTFIDDIFAFVIKMPTLYRIGCLRDDVVFFIFLYQKYIYPIDPKRINEFGTSGEPDQPIENTQQPTENTVQPTENTVQPIENGEAVAEPVENGEAVAIEEDKKNK